MNRYRDETRNDRRPTAPAGLWGSPEFLIGITRGASREGLAPGKPGEPAGGQALAEQPLAAHDPLAWRLARHVSRWLRWRGRAARPAAHAAVTKVAPAE